ncbi:putative target of rapamycin (TOR) kinase 1 [Trypanosoma cruzi]|uniref:Putative target of rapamycin (TOR) kinase 1 n=1 Tax=Trypanosoma cruzi TaxID=5693 RepID=A0A2V2WY06_TRYCR|nr:putative target of rapamycin (TOR) kinase 1 [Trypanosoma cruzi]
MGYKASPETLQIIITSAIAGVTTVVHPLWAAPPLVRIDVWIDNIRITGSKSGATLWEAQVLRNADGRRATMGEDHESGTTQYTFLGVQFDHTHQTVSLSEKFFRSVCAMPSLNSSTITGNGGYGVTLFCTRLPFLARVYVHITFSSRQCDDDYRQLTKGLCWRHPRRTFRRQWLVWARGYDTPSRTIASESSIPRKRHRPPSSRMHRSREVELFFIPDSGDVIIAGREWERKPFLIMQAEVRAVRLALSAFFPSCHPPWTFGWTTLRCKERRIKVARKHTP